MKSIHRLYKYLKYKSIPPTRFEKEIGVSNGYLGKALARDADIGSSIVSKILENNKDINPVWLLLGKGEMIIGSHVETGNEKTEEHEELTDAQRLQKVIDWSGLNTNKLSKQLGYNTSQTLYHITTGGRSLNSAVASKVCDFFPEISFEWLYRGEGNMFKPHKNDDYPAKHKQKLKPIATELESKYEPDINIIQQLIKDLNNQIVDLKIENEKLKNLLKENGIKPEDS